MNKTEQAYEALVDDLIDMRDDLEEDLRETVSYKTTSELLERIGNILARDEQRRNR